MHCWTVICVFELWSSWRRVFTNHIGFVAVDAAKPAHEALKMWTIGESTDKFLADEKSKLIYVSCYTTYAYISKVWKLRRLDWIKSHQYEKCLDGNHLRVSGEPFLLMYDINVIEKQILCIDKSQFEHKMWLNRAFVLSTESGNLVYFNWLITGLCSVKFWFVNRHKSKWHAMGQLQRYLALVLWIKLVNLPC